MTHHGGDDGGVVLVVIRKQVFLERLLVGLLDAVIIAFVVAAWPWERQRSEPSPVDGRREDVGSSP